MATVKTGTYHGDHTKAAGHHERVRAEVEQRGCGAFRRCGFNGDEQKPGVTDRRVGKHPLHITLAHRQDRADEQREHGKRVDGGLPGFGVLPEAHDEHADHPREAGGLDARGHVRHNGARCALIHVGRPRVKRCGRNLERQAHKHEREADEQHALVGQLTLGQEGLDRGQVGRAGGAVDERDAVQQKRRGKRAEHEVFDACLLRLCAAQVHGREHVHRDRQRLDAEEQDDEVVGAGHDDATRRRQQQQHIELDADDALTAQVTDAQQRGEHNRAREHRSDEERKSVDAVHARQRRDRAVMMHACPRRDHRGEGRDADADGVGRGKPRRQPFGQRRDREQRDRATDEHDQRNEPPPRHRWCGTERARRGEHQRAHQ